MKLISKPALSLLILAVVMCFIAPTDVTALDPAIYQAQQKLQEFGYDPGTLDGLWGGKTRDALIQFQTDNHLSRTGKLDDVTRKALGLKVLTSANKNSVGFNAEKSYEQCISTIIDKLLASKTNYVEQWSFGVLPNNDGFGGFIKLKNGSKVWVKEKNEYDAIKVFVRSLAFGIPGFATERFEVEGQLHRNCKYSQ